jgi:hypothetical protein
VLFNWAPRHEDVLGEWRNSFTHSWWRWRRVVSFTPRLLCSQGKSPWYPLDRRLGGPHSRAGRGGEEKHSQPLLGLEPPIIQPVVQRYTTELSLSYPVHMYVPFNNFRKNRRKSRKFNMNIMPLRSHRLSNCQLPNITNTSDHTLVAFPHLCLGIPTDLLNSCFPIKMLLHFLCLSYVLHILSMSSLTKPP